MALLRKVIALFALGLVVFSFGHTLDDKNQPLELLNGSTLIEASNDCVPWTRYDSGHQRCVCKKIEFFDGILKCNSDSQKLFVLDCHCMTYNETSNSIEVGACIENCFSSGKRLHDKLYAIAFGSSKKSLSSVNELMCNQPLSYNRTRYRTGRLCGRCLTGFYIQAYSYNMTCVNCKEGNTNLWKYFAIALAPLTVFYFLVLFFKINITSSHLHGYVIFAQAVSLPQFARTVTLLLELEPTLNYPIKFLSSLFGIWNLDFFRLFNWGICLKMPPLTVIALDYVIAIYPFFLTVVSYVLIELHDRNVRIVVVFWRPFRCIFTLFRRNWDIRTSIIDAYATFFQLSCFKILCTSFDLLVPTFVSIISGHENSELQQNAKLVLYYDSAIDYFGQVHLPYAILALTFIFLFSFIPILFLLIYPCRCFHCLFSCDSFILRTFMDSVNGCYKDGTERGTRDCRWFAAIDLLSRFILFLIYMVTLGSLYFPLAVLFILLIIILLSQIQPHKSAVSHYTKIDLTFYTLLALYYTCLSAANTAAVKSWYYTKGCYTLSVFIAFIPLIYISCLCVYWIFTRRRFGQTLINRIKVWWTGYDFLDDTRLPHRLLNPEQYTEPQNMTHVADTHAE
ncbi:uncharacterized protein LOC135342960 [Halichondria panicea]|uniref:uncharacterized protein LOC135342960 n=1 Tax=Halichondria panicea TaxID=6063 RepID=UPI00312BBFCD